MLIEGVVVTLLLLAKCVEMRLTMDSKEITKKWDKAMMNLGYCYRIYEAKTIKEGYECIVTIPLSERYLDFKSKEHIFETNLGCFVEISPHEIINSDMKLFSFTWEQAKIKLIYSPNSIPLKKMRKSYY